MILKKAKIIRDRLLSVLNPDFQLTDIQEWVFCESWKGRSYREMATAAGYEHDYLRQVGSHLWKLLSEATGRAVTKRNLHIILQEEYHRWQEAEQPPESVQDWGEATNVSQFWGREAELETLKRWVLNDRCSLVGIVGFVGVGKTALSVKFSQDVQNEFEAIVWRSLRHRPPLLGLLADILRVLHPDQKVALYPSERKMLSVLMETLQKRRCLLVLDNWDTVLQPRGNCLNGYCSGCEGYGEFLKYVGEIQHQSCAIVTGREKPDEIAILEGELLPVRLLKLEGMTAHSAAELLKAKGLDATEEEVRRLVDYYRGNPLEIKMAAATIKDRCSDHVDDLFVKHKTLCGGICQLIARQLKTLSNLEKKILYELAKYPKPAPIETLNKWLLYAENGDDICGFLTDLAVRSLVEKTSDGYQLPPAIAEYLNRNLEFCSPCLTDENTTHSSYPIRSIY